MELCWVRRSLNGLTDRISNEGVDREGLKLDATWINIPSGKSWPDCIQLVTKDYDDSRSTGDHIEAGDTYLNEGKTRSRPNPLGHLLNTSYNADHSHTTRRGTIPRSCQ